VFVDEVIETEPGGFPEPLFDAGIVLVVAGDEEIAVRGPEVGQRGGIGTEVIDGAIDKVAGEGDKIGFEAVDGVDDEPDEGALDGVADVDIGYLHDTESGKFGGEIFDGDFEFDNIRFPEGLKDTVAGEDGGSADDTKVEGVGQEVAPGRVGCRVGL